MPERHGPQFEKVESQPIILFDGICNLCNHTVQFVIRHDPGAKFKFASLQSDIGRKLSTHFGLATTEPGSFVLIENNKAFTRSTAALKVAKRLKGLPGLLYAFIIVPPFIRNGVYDIVAKNRYKWFGKKDTCMIPNASEQSRFLND